MRLLSFSWSHRSGDAAAREALAAVPVERVLAELKARGVSEAAALSTCNRFELYAAGTPAAPPDAAVVLAALAELSGFPVQAGAAKREGADAARHLFAVAAGLDSIVVGETEILGQVKSAYESAKGAGMTGSSAPSTWARRCAPRRRWPRAPPPCPRSPSSSRRASSASSRAAPRWCWAPARWPSWPPST
jgi:glutamyl-tRNA reductase